MASEPETVFDRLPSELVDIITKKVQQSCPKSFQALEQTCGGLRDSARRCSKTLVMTPSKCVRAYSALKRMKAKSERAEGTPSAKSKLPREKFCEELSLRPTVSKLKIEDTRYHRQFGKRGCPNSVLKTLKKCPWKEIHLDAPLGESYNRKTWERCGYGPDITI